VITDNDRLHAELQAENFRQRWLVRRRWLRTRNLAVIAGQLDASERAGLLWPGRHGIHSGCEPCTADLKREADEFGGDMESLIDADGRARRTRVGVHNVALSSDLGQFLRVVLVAGLVVFAIFGFISIGQFLQRISGG